MLFAKIIKKLNVLTPQYCIAKNYEDIYSYAESAHFPVLVRPSFVLGGRAMEIVHEKNKLKNFVEEAFKAAEENPILIDKFINQAMEVDVDAISDGKEVFVAGIMQHIEEAGIHSGDSACSLPPISIKPYLIKEIESQTKKLALALKVKGFMNIQFAIKNDEIFVIEVNPRASRTVPFVAKARGIPIAKIAAKIMTGDLLKDILTYKDLVYTVLVTFISSETCLTCAAVNLSISNESNLCSPALIIVFPSGKNHSMDLI